MKIGIYQAIVGGSLGGSDLVVATVAEALRKHHTVEIIHHYSGLSQTQLESFFHLNLNGVSLRCLPQSVSPWLDRSVRWWQLQTRLRREAEELTSPYDVFMVSTHWPPPLCLASMGILYVHFPLIRHPMDWERGDKSLFTLAGIRSLVRRIFYQRLWTKCLASYQYRFVNSQFTGTWTSRYWKTHCETLYPPAQTDGPEAEKTNQILVLGRFTPMKRQLDLVKAFGTMRMALSTDWSFTCVGGLGDGQGDQAYFQRIKEVADQPSTGQAIQLRPNASRVEVQHALECSKVFWHGVGHETDEQESPGLLEHFGIATVEAMAAGCVPVVINKGGQREIIEQGVSGFLCQSLDEMAQCTIRLVRDEALCSRMAIAARIRAQEFSREKFVERFLTTVKPLVCNRSGAQL